MKKVLIVIAIIIVFALGVYFSDEIISGVNKIFKINLDVDDDSDDLKDLKDKPSTESQSTLTQRAQGDILIPNKQGEIKDLKIKNDTEKEHKYYWMAVIWIPDEDPQKIKKLIFKEPDIIIEPPTTPPDDEKGDDIEIKITFNGPYNENVDYIWTARYTKKDRAWHDDKIKFTCWKANSEGVPTEQYYDYCIIFSRSPFANN